jgi:stage IV sporulation protein FB
MEKDRWDLGRIGGIPVAMHWTVLITALWLLFWLRDVVGTLIAIPVLIALFLAHEFGHVFVARRRRVKVFDITLSGLHGHTGHDTASHRDDVAIAWGGVGAQMVLLVAALLVSWFVLPLLPAGATRFVSPVLWVLVDLNIFFAVIALLPIGPFDGHRAWKVIGLVKTWWKKRGQPKPLSEKQHRDLDKQSRAEVVDLVERLKKKSAEKQANGKDTLH